MSANKRQFKSILKYHAESEVLQVLIKNCTICVCLYLEGNTNGKTWFFMYIKHLKGNIKNECSIIDVMNVFKVKLLENVHINQTESVYRRNIDLHNKTDRKIGMFRVF